MAGNILGEMNFKDIHSLEFQFGNITDDVLIAFNTSTKEYEKVSPVNFIGELLYGENRINVEKVGNKYALSVEFNTDNLTQIDTELKRIVGDI